MKAFGGYKDFPAPIKHAGYKEGHVWEKNQLDEWMANGGALATLIGDARDESLHDKEIRGMGLMSMEEKLREATDETEAAYKRFDAARQKFRSEIKNEVQSVEAAARKLAAEFGRVVGALDTIRATYTSAEFMVAVANAERIAAALKSIQELQSSRLTFAVIDNKTNPPGPAQ